MENYEHVFEEIRDPGHTEERARTRRGGKVRFAAAALALTVMAGAAGYGGAALYGGTNGPETTEEAPEAETTVKSDAIYMADSVASVNANDGVEAEELYEAVLPSCVGITVSTTVNIFGQTTTSAASGSGFILTSDGYIATNYHVIEEAAERRGVDIAVTLSDGGRYTAKLVGGDEDNDVAVIKIDADGLTPVTLGDSSSLRVAQWVCTVGNPLGELTFSFSDGRVSALDRVISTDAGDSMNMLQTNCAINPGNSGGPLFDGQGRVVGIVTAKYTNASSGVSAEGLGFAIPIDDVKDMLSDIMKYGYVTGKPILGISAATVSQALTRYGIPTGASVEVVNEGSGAERAGIKVGDIITSVDGKTVTGGDALSAAISAHRAGDTVTVGVYRQGQELTLQVTLGEKTADSENSESNENSDSSGLPYGWPFNLPAQA